MVRNGKILGLLALTRENALILLVPILAWIIFGSRSRIGPALVFIAGCARELIDLAHKKPDSPQLQEALAATLGAAELKAGTAAVTEGPDALFAVESASRPTLYIDDTASTAVMKQIRGSQWLATVKLKTGRSHSFQYLVDGKVFGGKADVPAYRKGNCPRSWYSPARSTTARKTITGSTSPPSTIPKSRQL